MSKKKASFDPIKGEDDTNVTQRGSDLTAVREHLGLPSISASKPGTDMGATFKSDMPMRKIDASELRAVSKQSNRKVASPNTSMVDNGTNRELVGATLSPTQSV